MSYNRSATPRPSEHLVRAVVAALVAQNSPGAWADDTAQKLYPGDDTTRMIIRAATSPASMTNSQWAGVLGSNAVADFVSGLGPVSAASQLIAMSLQVDLGRNASVQIPSLVPSSTALKFTAEGAPIPLSTLVLGGQILTPFKIAGMLAFTRETLTSTAVEPIARTVLRESVGLSLDAHMFSNLAAIAGERPAGLRNGVTPLAATAGGGEPAMVTDLVALAGAVAPVAGSAIAFVGSADVALKLALLRPELPYRVFSTAALPTGTLMAVAVNAFVVAVDPTPEIDVSTEALIHSDTAPAQIGTAGTPPVIAAPSRSMWQTDCTALRVVISASWGLRTPGAVAVVSGVTW